MKHRLALSLLAFSLALVACNPFQRQVARTVLDASVVACLLANAALPDSEVARVCGIVDGLDDPIRRLLSAQREQIAAAEKRGRVAAVGCQSGDAGVEVREAGK